MAQNQVSVKKQQGDECLFEEAHKLMLKVELQQQYTNYKNNLQQLAQRIGEIEQDTEEHKYVAPNFQVSRSVFSSLASDIGSHGSSLQIGSYLKHLNLFHQTASASE